MPAEWHPHESTWLVWPKNETTWPGDRLAQVQEAYLRMIETLLQGEAVDLLVDDESMAEEVKRTLRECEMEPSLCRLHKIQTVDSWIRDFGPNFLLRRQDSLMELGLNDWGFNAWGRRYPRLEADSRIPGRIASLLSVTSFSPPLILEGGAIDVNGEGACLTTEQCLLNPNRNPSSPKEEIEELLKEYLSLDIIIWLAGGLQGGDTDGHIDEVARFVGPGRIVCSLEEDPESPNQRPLQENYRRLQAARNNRGRPFDLITLPTPGPVGGSDRPLPASYCNFYIANRTVLLPTFGVPEDQVAKSTLQELFPTRVVVPIPCETVIWGMGSIHCLTQQQPALEPGPEETNL